MTVSLVFRAGAGEADPVDLGAALEAAQKAAKEARKAGALPDEDSRRLTRIIITLEKTPIGAIIAKTLRRVSIRDDLKMTSGYSARFTHDEKGNPYIGLGKKWRETGDEHLEFILLHEGAHACAGMPGELCDDEQHAYQRELEYAVQKTRVDADFAKRLKDRYKRFRDLEERRLKFRDGRLNDDEAGRYQEDFQREYGMKGDDYLGVLAMSLSQFHDSPGRFYWDVQKMYSQSPHHVTLQEVGDFLLLHGDGLDSLKPGQDDGMYYSIGNRRYRWAVIARAREVRDAGGIEAVKRKLGNFDTDGARRLQADIRKWEKEE